MDGSSMMKAASLLVGVGLLATSHADSLKPSVQYVSAAQQEAKVAHAVNGMVNEEIPSGPGSTILIIRREKDGEVEVHKVMNDVILIKSGHAKFLVGGEVSGNRETKPTEWRGGEITGATTYELAQGDLLYIPAGVPHKMLVAPKSAVTYVTVKIPTQPATP
jgi:mannose-6-phosphate isomerase-like protein (cupin superfamily)